MCDSEESLLSDSWLYTIYFLIVRVFLWFTAHNSPMIVLGTFLSHKEKSEQPTAQMIDHLLRPVVWFWGGNEKKREHWAQHFHIHHLITWGSEPVLSFLSNWGWGKTKNSDSLKLIRTWPSFCFRSFIAYTSYSSIMWSSRFCSRATSFCESSPLILQNRYGLVFFWLSTLLWKELRPLPGIVVTHVHIWSRFLALRAKTVLCSCQDFLQCLQAKVRLSKLGIERPSPGSD